MTEPCYLTTRKVADIRSIGERQPEPPDGAGLFHDRVTPSSGRLLAAKPIAQTTITHTMSPSGERPAAPPDEVSPIEPGGEHV
jgi:hypothetical protein